jgi:sortase A
MTVLASAGYLVFLAAQGQVFLQRAVALPERSPLGLTSTEATIGRMDIPALHLTAAVLNDDASTSLLHGVGHIPGTAELGGLGTVGLAGHRDTVLRPLRSIARGMEIRLTNQAGEYHYVVDSTEIVTPDAVQVLAIQSRPELALITCYPFRYVGAAPKRFVVHAHLISAAPDARGK